MGTADGTARRRRRIPAVIRAGTAGIPLLTRRGKAAPAPGRGDSVSGFDRRSLDRSQTRKTFAAIDEEPGPTFAMCRRLAREAGVFLRRIRRD